MATAASTSRFRNQILVGTTGVVTGGLLALAIAGSIISQGNFVCDYAKNPNCGLVSGVRAMVTPAVAIDTNSGGLAGRYDTLKVDSPFRSGASARGLRTGSGVVWTAQLDIIANPKGVSLDCTKVIGNKQSTGGTVIFNNITQTGSINLYSTPFTLGPTESVKCGSISAVTSAFSGALRLIMSDSDVVN
jgi:hypothetical protein